MNTNQISKRQNQMWLMAAIAAPLAKAVSGCSWAAVLVIGGITLLIGWWLNRYRAEQKPWLDTLQGLWASVVASELLFWCEECWPGYRDAKAAALILLALCIWSACGERRRGARVGCILIWPLGFLLGLILLSAVSEIKIENLNPSWQMPDAALVTILLVTTLYTGAERGTGASVRAGLLCYGILVSMVMAGVLSPRVSGASETGLYELSRSISFFGVSQRLESVAAAGMTIGYFGGIAYLLSIPEETANRSRMVLFYGVLAGGLFLMEIRLDSRVMAIGSILIWVVIPSLCSMKKIFQKAPKSP